MSSIHLHRLFRRLIKSPRYRRGVTALHEQWLDVILRRLGLVRG